MSTEIQQGPQHNYKSIPLLSTLILAGGQSSRMGRDKALLTWQGMPLLTRVCQVAQACSSHVQVLTPWPERYRKIVPQGVNFLQERQEGRGPLWALHQGLSQLSTPWLLLLACDMPQLNAAVLQQWHEHLSSLPETCLAWVPRLSFDASTHARWEPFCGFYHRRACAPLQTFLQESTRASFQSWLDATDAIAIAIDSSNRKMFYNCNRPEDLRP